MQAYNANLSLSTKQVNKRRDWAIAFLYTFFIYASLPVMPRLWNIFVSRVGSSVSDYFAAFVLLIFGFFIVFYLISRQKNIRSFIWLIILAFAYTMALSRVKLPIEKVHFIEYGLLSIFVFRALRHNIKNKSLYPWSAIAVFVIGFLDEGIQYVLPNRFFNITDVIVNGIAGILGLSLIGLCFRPAIQNLR